MLGGYSKPRPLAPRNYYLTFIIQSSIIYIDERNTDTNQTSKTFPTNNSLLNRQIPNKTSLQNSQDNSQVYKLPKGGYMTNANPLKFKTCKECGNYYVGKYCLECEYSTFKKNKPEYGKVYALTGATGTPCIANGNTWAESVVKQ